MQVAAGIQNWLIQSRPFLTAIRWGRDAGHHIPSAVEARRAATWPPERRQRALEAGRLYDRLRSTRAVAEAMQLNRRTVMALLRSEHNPYPYPALSDIAAEVADLDEHKPATIHTLPVLNRRAACPP